MESGEGEEKEDIKEGVDRSQNETTNRVGPAELSNAEDHPSERPAEEQRPAKRHRKNARDDAKQEKEEFKPPKWASRPRHIGNWLIDEKESTGSKYVHLDQTQFIVLGRDPSRCSHVLDRASRMHAALVWHTDGRLFCIDLGGKGTTVVDSSRAEYHKPKRVRNHSRVVVGDECIFQAALTSDPSDGTGSHSNRRHAHHHHHQHDEHSASLQAESEHDDASTRLHANHHGNTAGIDTSNHLTEHIDGAHAAAEDQSAGGNKVRCKHILLRHTASRRPKGSTRSEEEATSRAYTLLKQIESGSQDFDTVARAESECGSAVNGGDVGSFGRGKMQPSFEEAAFALNVNEMMSEPLHTDSGVHIIWRIE